MQFDNVWATVRERCGSLSEEDVLETPTTSRVLRVEGTDDEGIDVRAPETAESRTLNRDRFESLVDEIADGGLDLDAVPPGGEAYVAVLSLHPDIAIRDDELVVEPDAETETLLLKHDWDERTAPVRLRDDATLLAELLDRFEGDSMSVESLVDLYVLLSDVQYESGDLREDVRDDLLDRMDEGERLHGRFGAVTRTERERRHLKDEATILHLLDEHDIPREWVLSVDRQQLDVVVAATDLDEEDVYDVERDSYVQKTDVDRLERDAHVEGLTEQLPHLESERARELHDELADIEERIDSLLATS